VIYLGRQNAMAPPMARQKINVPAGYGAADDCIRGRPEGRLDAMFCHVSKPFHVIQAAAADDSNRGLRHESAIETKPLRQWKAKCRNFVSKHV